MSSRAGRAAARRLVVEGLLALGGPRQGLAALAAGEVDWDLLLGLAERHAVAEGLHEPLERSGAAVPAVVRAALRDAHELAAVRNTVLLAEAARVQGALERAQIRSVVLKGLALLAANPRAIGSRHVGDIDLLVAPEDLGRANGVARAHGCRSAGTNPFVVDGTLAAAAGRIHLPALTTPAGMILELHGRPAHDPRTVAWTAPVLDRALEVSWSARTLRVPSLDDQLAIVCAHALHDERSKPVLRPRHLGDLAVLSAAGASFSAAATRLPGAAEALASSRALLDGAGAGASLDGRLLEPRDRLRTRVRRLALTLRAGRAEGGLLRTFFPAPDFLAHRYGVRRQSPLLPFLYLWRPVRAGLRLLTGR